MSKNYGYAIALIEAAQNGKSLPDYSRAIGKEKGARQLARTLRRDGVRSPVVGEVYFLGGQNPRKGGKMKDTLSAPLTLEWGKGEGARSVTLPKGQTVLYLGHIPLLDGEQPAGKRGRTSTGCDGVDAARALTAAAAF